MVGAILLGSALIFGAIAGGVIVHRLQAVPTASSQQEHSDKVSEQGDAPSKNKHTNPGQHPSAEPDDSQDKDA
jgi:hypothetical protein